MDEKLLKLKKKFEPIIDETLFEKCNEDNILITFDDLVGLEENVDFFYTKFFLVNNIVDLAQGKCIKVLIGDKNPQSLEYKNLEGFLFLLDQLNKVEKYRIGFGEGPKDRKPLRSVINILINQGIIPKDDDLIGFLLFHMDFVIDFRPLKDNPGIVEAVISVRSPLDILKSLQGS